MKERQIGFTDGGGIYFELTNGDGETARIAFEPTDNGQMEIVVETADDVENRGTIKPGAADAMGVGL